MRDLLLPLDRRSHETRLKANTSPCEQIKLTNLRNRSFFSLELCATGTELDFAKLRDMRPDFCTIPWFLREYANLNDVTSLPEMQFARTLISHGHQVLLHLAANNLAPEEVTAILRRAKSEGLKNIFALQGDQAKMLKKRIPFEENFRNAIDLVAFARRHFGEHFSLGVAAYPESHPDSGNPLEDMMYLRQKVRAGSDYVLTQVAFDRATLMRFAKNCAQIGIGVPIAFSMYLFDSHENLAKVCKLCNVRLPGQVHETAYKNRNNLEAVRNYSLFHHFEMLDAIGALKCCYFLGVNFITLNRLEIVHDFVQIWRFYESYLERPMKQGELEDG